MAFWQLTLPISPETTDALTNFLWEQGALGVVEEEAPPTPPELRAFFAGTASSAGLVRAVVEYQASLRALGFPVEAAPPEIAPLHDDEWASAWQQSFPPLSVGQRLLVVPPWHAGGHADAARRVEVVIEPGRAFGTGHHGSTEGCLRLLEESISVRPVPASLLDLGTGTGILAIAAIKLGVPRALGIDIDPDAIAAARLNAARNACADRLCLELHGPEQLPATPPFPLVVANLLTHSHVAFVPHYVRLTAPGGTLVLGGILAEDAERVTGALEAEGFACIARVVIEGWASLGFHARADRR